MSLFHAAVLGIVQGLTEFLPVSSSGHLVLANYYLGWGSGLKLWVDIATNTGTLLAVLIYLRRDVAAAVGGFVTGLGSASVRQGAGWRMALLVIVGSIPTAIIGLGLKDVFNSLNAPLPVSIALIVTGFILWFAPRSGHKHEVGQVSFRDAVTGGIAQGLAVIPGISRSGITIATFLARRTDGEMAARLSFLMYLVVSVGVTVLGVRNIEASHIGALPVLAMFVTSFVTGYLALMVLFAVLRRGRFRVFSPYLWAVGIITIIHVALR
jgi:undecaprenyl-diphosphatase